MTAAPPNLRKRLWLAGSAIALFIGTLAAAGWVMEKEASTGTLWLGHDFLPAYIAGQLTRQGEPAKMYDRPAFRAAQDRIVSEAGLEMTGRYGACLNPPHLALLFAPLSALPYRPAAAVWLAMNAAFFAASLVLLVRLLPPEARGDWKTWGLVPLLATASMPFLQAAGHQQNTFLSLLILTATVTLWRSRRALAAGAMAGLLFYKPQLALVVALVLVADLGWRAALGLGVTGLGLLLLTVWLMPGALPEYARSLASNVDWIQSQPTYNWGRQVTTFGFARLLFQGHAPGAASALTRAAWLGAAAVGVAGLAFTVFKIRRQLARVPTNTFPRDRLIALTIASTPLLLPYYLDYDLLLLSVPAVLFAGDVIRRATGSPVDRWTMRAWVALYLWPYANPGLSGMMRLNPAAPLLAAVAAGLVARALRPEAAAPVREFKTDDPPLALAA